MLVNDVITEGTNSVIAEKFADVNDAVAATPSDATAA